MQNSECDNEGFSNQLKPRTFIAMYCMNRKSSFLTFSHELSAFIWPVSSIPRSMASVFFLTQLTSQCYDSRVSECFKFATGRREFILTFAKSPLSVVKDAVGLSPLPICFRTYKWEQSALYRFQEPSSLWDLVTSLSVRTLPCENKSLVSSE